MGRGGGIKSGRGGEGRDNEGRDSAVGNEHRAVLILNLGRLLGEVRHALAVRRPGQEIGHLEFQSGRADRLPAQRHWLDLVVLALDELQLLARKNTNPVRVLSAESRSRTGCEQPWRSEERRVGKEWVSTCRSRWSQSH